MSARIPLAEIEQVVGGHAAVRAAAETGVLEHLEERAAAPADVAKASCLDERLCGALLRVLAALGVATVDDAGRYRAARGTATALEMAEGIYAGLAPALRGSPPSHRVDSVEGAATRYPTIVPLLAERLAPPAAELAARLARPGLQILDAGAGAALWSIAITRAEPTCRVVAVDLAEVLAATREAVNAAGLAERFDLVAGDLFALPLQPRHDLVIVGQLCHLFSEERATTLLRRLAGALRPDGRLAVVDVPGDAIPPHDPTTVVYALGLTLRTEHGGLHTRGDYTRWLAEAGLVDVETIRLSGQSLWAFTGRRPSSADVRHRS